MGGFLGVYIGRFACHGVIYFNSNEVSNTFNKSCVYIYQFVRRDCRIIFKDIVFWVALLMQLYNKIISCVVDQEFSTKSSI